MKPIYSCSSSPAGGGNAPSIATRKRSRRTTTSSPAGKLETSKGFQGSFVSISVPPMRELEHRELVPDRWTIRSWFQKGGTSRTGSRQVEYQVRKYLRNVRCFAQQLKSVLLKQDDIYVIESFICSTQLKFKLQEQNISSSSVELWCNQR